MVRLMPILLESRWRTLDSTLPRSCNLAFDALGNR